MFMRKWIAASPFGLLAMACPEFDSGTGVVNNYLFLCNYNRIMGDFSTDYEK